MMRTYRGIVCEKNKTDMIFLTSEGEYLRGIPLRNAEVGEEVPFRLATKPVLRQKKIIGPALIAAVLLIVFIASLIPQSSSAYAYVQVEGKQNIEFGVDKAGKVVSVKSHEKTFIADDWEGLTIDVALSKAVKEIAPADEKVAIKTVYEKDGQTQLKKQIDKAVSNINQKQHKSKKELKKEEKSPEIKEEQQVTPNMKKISPIKEKPKPQFNKSPDVKEKPVKEDKQLKEENPVIEEKQLKEENPIKEEKPVKENPPNNNNASNRNKNNAKQDNNNGKNNSNEQKEKENNGNGNNENSKNTHK